MEIQNSDYSVYFDKLRKNRVEISTYKYGHAKDNFGKHLVNAIESAQMCIQKYKDTHNTEYLCDAANYMMFEFMYPQFNDATFKATDSNESAGISGISIKEMEDIKNESC